MRTHLMIVTLLLICLPGPGAGAEETSTPPAAAGSAGGDPAGRAPPSIWDRVTVGTLWYLTYANGQEKGKGFNATRIGRGYLGLTFKPVDWLEPRITLDTHQDDEGNWGVRLKYLYLKLKLPRETRVISDPYLEAGLAHTPWFDFEEHVNHYRMEGTMFIERNGVLNSADLGVTAGALIGRRLPAWYRERVSDKYPGLFGSFALGVYNGGGYHAAEKNNDKVFMSRLSLRPLGPWIPHLQLSHFFVYGKGNTAEVPTWWLHDFMVSLEHRFFVLTAQLALGKGNQKGDKVNEAGYALDLRGTSVFGELKLPWIRSSVIGRFDIFDWAVGEGEPSTYRLIAGYALHVYQKNVLLLSLDRVSTSDPARDTDWQVKLTAQVKYP